MIDRDQFWQAMNGCLMLMRGDVAGLERFDVSIEGFWRSFQAAIFAAPLYFLLLFLQPSPSGLSGWSFLISGVLTFTIGWVFFPLLALGLSRFYGLTDRYVPLIVAVNWMALPQLLIFTAAIVLSLILPAGIVTLFLLVITVAVLYIQWFVIKSALATTAMTAITFLFLDLVINQTLQTFIESGFTD